MEKHFSIRITGKVQGVFFRASTLKAAEANTIRGLVRNEPDGSVYIEAEGADENLTRFMDWCKNGPQGARVDRIDFVEGNIRNFENFRIDR